MLMSPATQRVLATLAEKNLKFEMKIVDLTTGENQVGVKHDNYLVFVHKN